MLYFCTDKEFPIEAITLMGVSVKETDDPIGRFGTGLKYAISVILRHTETIHLHIDGKDYTFSTVPLTIRGKQFLAVTMNGEQLGFTTELGKDWELWMAYRELVSNTLDESGEVRLDPPFSGNYIEVSGLERFYHGDESVFISKDKELLWESNDIQIYKGMAKHIYYKGIRVMTLPVPTKLTYNLTGKTIKLSEDRLIKNIWDANYAIMRNLQRRAPYHIVKAAFDDPTTYEHYADLVLSDPSDDAVRAILDLGKLAPERLYALAVEKSRGDPEEFLKHTVSPTPEEAAHLKNALEIARQVYPAVGLDDINLLKELPRSMLAYQNPDSGKVYLSRKMLKAPKLELAGCIIEEFTHAYYGHKDETRELETFLFNLIASLCEDLMKHK